jgi:hypothetical protein
MSHDPATITEEEFNGRFGVRAIHLRRSKFGSEIDAEEFLAREAEQQFINRYGTRCIWTLIEDEKGVLYLLSGYHLINHIGLVASREPRPTSLPILVRVDDSLRNEVSLS